MSELISTRELLAEQQRAARAPQAERVRAGGSFDLSAAMADSQGFKESRPGSTRPLQPAAQRGGALAGVGEIAQGTLANLALTQLAESRSQHTAPNSVTPSMVLDRVAETIVARVSVSDHVAITELDLGEHGILKIQLTVTGSQIDAELEGASRPMAQGLIRHEVTLRAMLAAEGLTLASLRVTSPSDTTNAHEQFDNDRQNETDSESSLLSLIRRASSVL